MTISSTFHQVQEMFPFKLFDNVILKVIITYSSGCPRKHLLTRTFNDQVPVRDYHERLVIRYTTSQFCEKPFPRIFIFNIYHPKSQWKYLKIPILCGCN